MQNKTAYIIYTHMHMLDLRLADLWDIVMYKQTLNTKQCNEVAGARHQTCKNDGIGPHAIVDV
jgi:hypothetical protein